MIYLRNQIYNIIYDNGILNATKVTDKYFKKHHFNLYQQISIILIPLKLQL